MPKVLSGGDQLIFDIVPRLPKDLQITIVMPRFAEEHWQKIGKLPNVRFVLLPPNRFDFKSNPLAIFLTYAIRARQVYSLLKTDEVQTIYSCSDIAYADIWPAYWLRKKKPSVQWFGRVYHVLLEPGKRQGSWISNAVAYYLQKLSFLLMKKRCSVTFALNEKLKNELLDLGFPPKRLAVLGAGIDYRTIQAFKQTKHYPYDVIVMGRVAPVKGIFDTITAWEKIHLKHPTLRLGWIGSTEGGVLPKVTSQLKKKGLEETFTLLGFVEKTEAFNILRSAKIFLCPDHENGWGLAVCEAMSSGLPVVSYDLDIFGSVYKAGYLSSPLFDTSSLADNIMMLLSDEDKRKKLAKYATAQARKFDHDKVIGVLVQYL